MTTTFYDDEDLDLDLDDLGEEEEPEAVDDQDDDLAEVMAGIADSYSAADPRERRALWQSLDPDEQDALRAMGIAGPASATADQDFEPVAPGEPGYASIVTQSASLVHAALRQIGTGHLDVDDALAAEIEDLVERADRFDDGAPRGKLLQRAAHLVERARQAAADAIPFAEGDVIERVDHGRQHDGTYLIEERDRRGKVRRTTFTAAEVDAAEAALLVEEGAGPVPDPAGVTLEEAAAWDWPTTKAFMAAHPDAWDELLQGASIRMMTDR